MDWVVKGREKIRDNFRDFAGGLPLILDFGKWIESFGSIEKNKHISNRS